MQVEQFTQTFGKILCCMCGTPIEPNPSNMCVACLRAQVDITEGIPTQLVQACCRGCGRYLNPPESWVPAAPESRELLTLCLKRLKGPLSKAKLIDAGFIWTEPHSKRLKVKLTIQKEVFRNTILQQGLVVEFLITNQQCKECQRFEAKNTWVAVVQVRQKVQHKRTFLFLEQLILKHKAATQVVNIKEQKNGLDFFFINRSHAIRFVDFLNTVVSIQTKSSERLVSHDDKSNVANFKYSYAAEIAPICKEDLICLPPKLAHHLGGVNPIVLCTRVSSTIRLIDPSDGKRADVPSSNYWKYPFNSLASVNQAVLFMILDISPEGPFMGTFQMAEFTAVKDSDFGKNDKKYYGRTHLGHLLNCGDYAMGYDLSSGNFNSDELRVYTASREAPDVVLVKKAYPNRRRNLRPRKWKLETLSKEELKLKKIEEERAANDQEMFMRDLEEDVELRKEVDLYKADVTAAMSDEEEEDDEDGFPEIDISELKDKVEAMSLKPSGDEA